MKGLRNILIVGIYGAFVLFGIGFGFSRDLSTTKETDEAMDRVMYMYEHRDDDTERTFRFDRHVDWYEMDKDEKGNYIYIGSDGVIHSYDSEYVNIMKENGKTGVMIQDDITISK